MKKEGQEQGQGQKQGEDNKENDDDTAEYEYCDYNTLTTMKREKGRVARMRSI